MNSKEIIEYVERTILEYEKDNNIESLLDDLRLLVMNEVFCQQLADGDYFESN